MSPKKPKPQGKAGKCYRVDLGRDVNEERMYVKFAHGVGVLDLGALMAYRPDWIENTPDGLRQHTGVALEEYAKYWEDQGAKVTEISPKEAAEIRLKARLDRDAYLRQQGFNEQADQEKREREAEEEGKEAAVPDEGQQLRDQAQAEQDAIARGDTPAAEPKPHEVDQAEDVPAAESEPAKPAE